MGGLRSAGGVQSLGAAVASESFAKEIDRNDKCALLARRLTAEPWQLPQFAQLTHEVQQSSPELSLATISVPWESTIPSNAQANELWDASNAAMTNTTRNAEGRRNRLNSVWVAWRGGMPGDYAWDAGPRLSTKT